MKQGIVEMTYLLAIEGLVVQWKWAETTIPMQDSSIIRRT